MGQHGGQAIGIDEIADPRVDHHPLGGPTGGALLLCDRGDAAVTPGLDAEHELEVPPRWPGSRR